MVTYVPLPGSRRHLLPNSRPAGPVDRGLVTNLTVRVRSRGNPSELVDRAYDLANMPVKSRKYLSYAELERGYGARSADLDKVEHFAATHDLQVVRRSALERTVVLRGALGDILHAFHADVQNYHHAAGSYRGRTGDITLPAELSDVITGLFGFDTRPKVRAPYWQRRLAFDGPGGSAGVTATDFATRYAFPPGLDGAGQTIGIIELGGGYRSSDLQLFFQEVNIPLPRVSAVSVDSADNNPGNPDVDGEVMLDIEVAGAVAPGANFAVYFAPNNGDKGFIDAISAAVHDTERKPDVLSISWGASETTSDQQGVTAYHEVFAAAGALGITVCAATGDHGTANDTEDQWDHGVHVNHPSSDDLVLACGGTQIDQGVDVVWNDGTPFAPNDPGGGGWTTGGGISQVFAVPAYQKNIKLPAALDGGKAGRGVPDIAMSATNFFTRVDSSEGASGGTSAVAPLMAALVARLNQSKKKNVGFLNPFLYSNAATGIVHDVVRGTNAIKDTAKGYKAGPGWDACTGLGTPIGSAILEKLP